MQHLPSIPQLRRGQLIGPFEVIAPLRTRYGATRRQSLRPRSQTSSSPATPHIHGGQADIYLVRPADGNALVRRWIGLQRWLFGDTPSLVERYKIGALKITEPRYRENLIDELDYLFRVQHPHIVALYSRRFPNIIPRHQERMPLEYTAGEPAEKYPYIALEYETGGSLQQYLRVRSQPGHQRTLAPAQAVLLAQQLADALGKLHEVGVVHRDIAPANIVFRRPLPLLGQRPPEAVLIDLAAANSFPRYRFRKPWGRWRYLPPEGQPRPNGEPVVNPQIDMYMLGLLLYELLTGRLEEQEKTQRTNTSHREPLVNQRNPQANASPELEHLIADAINRDPVQRQQALPSMAAFRQRLDVLPEAGKSQPFRARPSLRRSAKLGTLAATLVLMLALSGFAWMGMSPGAAAPTATPTITATSTPSPEPTEVPTPTAVAPTITRVPISTSQTPDNAAPTS